MTPRFSGADITTNELRAELIALSEKGEKEKASTLLKELAKRQEATAGELVDHYLERTGSSSLETTLAGLAWLCFGLVFGIIGLTFGGFVGVDLETLVILVGAFLTGQACLTTYNSVSTAKHFAQEFTKLAGSRKMSQLMKQQFSPVSMAYAYSA